MLCRLRRRKKIAITDIGAKKKPRGYIPKRYIVSEVAVPKETQSVMTIPEREKTNVDNAPKKRFTERYIVNI